VAGSAIITGASSGIGMALARELWTRGYSLGLTARRLDLLEDLADELRADVASESAMVETARLDVADTDTVPVVLKTLSERLDGVSLVVANAGVALNHRAGHEGFERDASTIQVNLIGAMATVDAAVSLFKSRGRGHVVALSSVAAFRGLPGMGAYSASKAGLAIYMEAVRAELGSSDIRVTTLYPGYIDTPLNEDMASRPFLISAADGAKRIADLIQSGVNESTVPVFPWNVAGFVMRQVPSALWTVINRPKSGND